MDAALDELIGDPRGVAFGNADAQLVASWQLNDRELPVAMASAALEVTRMLMPALRRASRRSWRRGARAA